MDEKPIDFCALEKELHGRIREDERYWQQNDAKFRAVEQKVATYEEFRQMVMAAHLKPLDKKDKVPDPSSKFIIWNTIAGMNNVEKQKVSLKQPIMRKNYKGDDKLVITSGDEFLKQWKCLSEEDRLNLLQQLEHQHFKKLFDLDIPVGVLNDVCELFSSIQMDKSNLVFVFKVLEQLSKSKRFQLNLQFLSSSEKSTIRNVFNKLSNSFLTWKEELSREGLSGEEMSELRKKYQV